MHRLGHNSLCFSIRPSLERMGEVNSEGFLLRGLLTKGSVHIESKSVYYEKNS